MRPRLVALAVLCAGCGGPIDQALFPGVTLGLLVVGAGACWLGWRKWTSARRDARRDDRRRA